MGSSKKSKDKDRDRDHKRKRKHRSRSRSRSRERKHKREDPTYGYAEGATKESFERKKSRREPTYDDYDEKPPVGDYVSSQVPKVDTKVESDEGFANKSSGGGREISLSIQETNRLRAKLGLKPLEDPAVKAEADANEDQEVKTGTDQADIHKPAVNLTQVKQSENIQKKLLEIKEKRKINQKLGKVRTLADSDSDDEGALAWIKKSRKLAKEKELAEKRAKALAEMDEEFGISNLLDQEFEAAKQKTYDSKDLKGLRVMHDQDRFKEGMTTILTLQDKGILDEDADDVLVNYNLMDDEKADQNIINKKKKPDYNPYDDSTVDEYGMMQQKNLLSKYDEEIEGKKMESFALGSGGRYDAHHEKAMRQYQNSLKQKADNLQLPTPNLATEFYTETEMESFKKVKKKVRKIRKKPKMVKADDLIPLGNSMNGASDLGRRGQTEPGEVPMETSAIPGLDLVETTPAEEEEEEVLGPDIDLTGVPVEDEGGQESSRILSKARRLKERKEVPAPEAAVLSRVRPIEEHEEQEPGPVLAGSVILNSTSEFCRALGDIPTYGQAGNRPEEEEDELMEFENELAEERRRREEEEAEQAAGWQAVEIDNQPVDIRDEEHPALDEEPVVGGGLASALQLARKKGFLELELSKKGASARRNIDIEAQNYSIEDKRYEDLDDKYRKRERYAGGVTSDFKELNYKPDVKLEYVDDTGRQLNAKEAFRQLSHRFHGKGSGKKKTEKRTKKLEQDQLLKNASSTDTPLGTVTLFREKQRAEKSPYLVLSGANKATLTGGSVSKTT